MFNHFNKKFLKQFKLKIMNRITYLKNLSNFSKKTIYRISQKHIH